MESNDRVTTPRAAGTSCCHGPHQGSGNWFARRRGVLIVGLVIVAAVALGLSQEWFTVAVLTPLLFALSCAAMMYMCMKGTKHGEQTGAGQAPARADPPNVRESRG